MEHILNYNDQSHKLEKDGIIHIHNFFPKEVIYKITNKVKKNIEERSFISRVRNQDLENPEKIENGISQFFDPNTLKNPSFPLKENTKGVNIFAIIGDILLTIFELLSIRNEASNGIAGNPQTAKFSK